MLADPTFAALPPVLAAALASRGFVTLTPIQQAVLDPAHAGRDLRLFSQTGSGKTVAVGLVLAPDLERVASPTPATAATPRVILIAPTRELAAQLARELSWLFQPLGATVCPVTGGTSYALELRALRKNPLVIVGTPGRLLDHLERGSIDPSEVTSAVLDEADQMLDLGFREDLEAILGKLPEGRRTHLIAATFSREVRALADRYQRDALDVEGTILGRANEDIAHVAHLVRPDERDAALINVLLLSPGERALVFVRTREGAAELADRLAEAGFTALSLSGELEQRERTRTLEAFRGGAVTTLVATDVAARGLDIPDVNRVIHADPPGDADTLVHRSGRTGRAGRKGTSVILVPPAARAYVARLFHKARARVSWSPAPTPEDVLREADARLLAELTAPPTAAPDPRLQELAKVLLRDVDPTTLVTALLSRAQPAGLAKPLPVTAITPPPPPPPFARPAPFNAAAPPRRSPRPGAFVSFRVTWGGRHGADARRLLALVCRRGGINSNQVGAIHVGERMSTVEVASPAAPGFAQQAKRPDTRDPRIQIEPMSADPGGVKAGSGASRGSAEAGSGASRGRAEAGSGAERPRRHAGFMNRRA